MFGFSRFSLKSVCFISERTGLRHKSKFSVFTFNLNFDRILGVCALLVSSLLNFIRHFMSFSEFLHQHSSLYELIFLSAQEDV